MSKDFEILDPSPDGMLAQEYRSTLDRYIVGQNRAKDKVIEILLNADIGLNDPDQPLGKIANFGASGTGKTWTIEVLAKILFGDQDALTRIDGQDFESKYSVTTLTGAPPGLVGYDDLDGSYGRHMPILCQEKIEEPGILAIKKEREFLEEKISRLESDERGSKSKDRNAIKQKAINIKKKIGFRNRQLIRGVPPIVLFDEIERMHRGVRQILFTILDKHKLRMKNGNVTDFTNAIIAMTGNIGEGEISRISSDFQMGFHANESKDDADKRKQMSGIVISHLKKEFGAPFLGRLGLKSIVIFDLMSYEEKLTVLNRVPLAGLSERLREHESQLTFEVNDALRKAMLDEALNNPEIGMRGLAGVVDDWIKKGLIFLLDKDPEKGGIKKGDHIIIRLKDENGKKMPEFVRKKKIRRRKQLPAHKK